LRVGISVPISTQGYLLCSTDEEDESADVAICPISIGDSAFDIVSLPEGMFATKKLIDDLKINENDEILFTGLFASYTGSTKNFPIVRHGKLALIPQERIPFNGTLEDLYLGEVTSWGGNSGSPVFVRLTGTRETGDMMTGIQYFLLGVMQGYFNSGDVSVSFDTAAATDTAHIDLGIPNNSGIAAIVPAAKISRILSQPRVKAYVSLVRAGSLSQAKRAADAESWYKNAITILRDDPKSAPLLKSAFQLYANFLESQGRFPEAHFQQQLSNRVVLKTP
jgi:hypothetical protein